MVAFPKGRDDDAHISRNNLNELSCRLPVCRRMLDFSGYAAPRRAVTIQDVLSRIAPNRYTLRLNNNCRPQEGWTIGLVRPMN
jgi:hypothetical protein